MLIEIEGRPLGHEMARHHLSVATYTVERFSEKPSAISFGNYYWAVQEGWLVPHVLEVQPFVG